MRAITLILACLLASPGLVLADKKAQKSAANPSLENYFRTLDLNGDGFVSLAEAAGDQVVVQRFDKGDRNRDGKLSDKEFANLGKVKLRVAKRKDKEKEASAAVGASGERRTKGKAAAGGG